MFIYDLSCERPAGLDFGGKANTLGRLFKEGFPVPPGIAISAPPESDSEWNMIFNWWAAQNGLPLAVRSSACGEDGEERSFAGQHETILNVSNPIDLRKAVSCCFASLDQENARMYRREMGIDSDGLRMNVLLQVMITPKYAGVYFSNDPRSGEKNWLIEYVEGLGEDLVSGRVTPKIIHSDVADKEISPPFQEVRDFGVKAAAFLGYELDMEWAIDKAGGFHVLQCRPITAEAAVSRETIDAYIQELNSEYAPDTVWDGQAFAEWPGVPSTAGYKLWADAFCPGQAFDKALCILGYKGASTPESMKAETLLDRVFGRPYVNLDRLMPSFYGDLPCRMVATPEPELKFDARQLRPSTILRVPSALMAMLRVAGRMSSARSSLLAECRQALEMHKTAHETSFSSKAVSPDELLTRLNSISTGLVSDDLKWSFALIMLVQSTQKMLESHLKKILGSEQASKTIRDWMSIGLNTETRRMNTALQHAIRNPEDQAGFLDCYGHRGSGELDIANPRWNECADTLFASMPHDVPRPVEVPESESVETQIDAMKSFRKTLVSQEWALLREMLELREEWKMSLMRTFARIRSCLLDLGIQSGLEDDIFHLSLDEIIKAEFESLNTEKNRCLIQQRKSEQLLFTSVSLPAVFALRDLDKLFNRGNAEIADIEKGEALSPGVAVGEVRIVVGDPADANPALWPADVILVAESTDPGWTPLFSRVRGIVVEKGGVLSHCAILAREMRIPAVSQIHQCHLRFCDGDRILMDGIEGTVRMERNV